MKKIIYLMTWFSLLSMLIIACGKKEPAAELQNQSITEAKEARTFQAIVLNKESMLVSPDKESVEYKSSDQIAVGIQEVTVYKNGDLIELNEIQNGDILKITYNGDILESYPAQISAERIEIVETRLVDGYQALIEDIYNEDSALNSEIEQVVIDTTDLKDLTGLEQEKLFLRLNESLGMKIREGTYDQLVEEGLIDDNALYFEKGVLIKIINPSHNDKITKITCGTSKWRGGLGAIGSDQVTARFKESGWVITKEGIWIS